MYFQTKINYLKQIENGSVVKVSEDYVLPAESFLEAETNLQEFLEELIPEYSLERVAKLKVTDIIHTEKVDWFKAKLAYVSYDEDSGKQKKIQEYFLVQADAPAEVIELIKEHMDGAIVDWKILSIAETGIKECFFFDDDKPSE